MSYEYSLWYILISILLSSLAAILLYKDELKKKLWSYFLMAFLRFSMFFLLLMTLGGLYFSVENKSPIKPTVFIALDVSSSMKALEDSTVISDIFTFLKANTPTSYDIKFLGFGDYVRQITKPEYHDNNSDFKSLEESIDLLSRENDKLIIISDGNVNKGGFPFLTDKKYHIDIIGIGDTTEVKSIDITRINYNKRVILNNRFPIELFIKGNHIGNSDLNLEVSMGDSVVYKESIKQNLNNVEEDFESSFRFEFLLSKAKKGISNYKIKIFDSSDISVYAEKEIAIYGEKTKGHVLIKYVFPHPEISLYKRELQKRNYKVTLSKNEITIDSIRKFDFAICFNESARHKFDVPTIYIYANKGVDFVSISTNKTVYVNEYITIKKDENRHELLVEGEGLWRKKLQDAKWKKYTHTDVFDILISEVELMKNINRFKLFYKDKYATWEDVNLELINSSFNINGVKSYAEININGKAEKIDFIGDKGRYNLALGKMHKGSYRVKIFIDNTFFKSIIFTVNDISAEQNVSRQNTTYLKKILAVQKGNYYSKYNYKNVLEKYNKNTNRDSILEIKKMNVLEFWYFLLLTIFIFAVEWYLRKRQGLF